MGLTGVGIATLSANFLYFLLSIIIVLPGLKLIYPKLTLNRIYLSLIPSVGLYYLFANYINLPALTEMLLLLAVFYGIYFLLARTVMIRPE